jgi:hypothetical protein
MEMHEPDGAKNLVQRRRARFGAGNSDFREIGFQEVFRENVRAILAASGAGQKQSSAALNRELSSLRQLSPAVRSKQRTPRARQAQPHLQQRATHVNSKYPVCSPYIPIMFRVKLNFRSVNILPEILPERSLPYMEGLRCSCSIPLLILGKTSRC